MKHLLTSILFIALIAYLGMGVFLYWKQRSFIYFPVQYATSDLEQIIFQHQGESISVSVLNPGQKTALLYFGGNAENVDFNAPDFSTQFHGYTIYLVKYRGYGSSTGIPTEAGINADALHIYDQLSQSHGSIVVVGRSLGSGVATYLAANRDVNKLVLVTPFDSIRSVAQKLFPIYPLRWLLKDQYDSLNRVDSIKARTLIIAAEQDQVITRNHTDKLAAAFDSQQLQYEVISGHGHNDLSGTELYYEIMNEFFK